MSTPRGCSVDGCAEPHGARGMCDMHYARWSRHGHPRRITGGDAVGYWGMHRRLRRKRGPASSNPCQLCEETARDWAYDGLDPSEQTDRETFKYSTDLDRYIPLCRKCHIRLDGRWSAA